jgi:hypothetical protein
MSKRRKRLEKNERAASSFRPPLPPPLSNASFPPSQPPFFLPLSHAETLFSLAST